MAEKKMNQFILQQETRRKFFSLAQLITLGLHEKFLSDFNFMGEMDYPDTLEEEIFWRLTSSNHHSLAWSKASVTSTPAKGISISSGETTCTVGFVGGRSMEFRFEFDYIQTKIRKWGRITLSHRNFKDDAFCDHQTFVYQDEKKVPVEWSEEQQRFVPVKCTSEGSEEQKSQIPA